MELEAALCDAFIAEHPSDAARVIGAIPLAGAAKVVADSPTTSVAELLRHLTPLTAARLLEHLAGEVSAAVLDAMRRDSAAAVLRAMETTYRSKVLSSLSPDGLQALKRLLRYAAGTAGALMDPRVLVMGERVTVEEALRGLGENPQHALYYVYVVDGEHRLEGVVNIRELIAARREQLLGLIAARPVVSLAAGASWESVATNPAWKRFHALPVVEADGRFLGVVRYESVLEFERQVGATPLDSHTSQTAIAVGELYSLGLRGLMHWAAAALVGPPDSDQEQR